MSKKTSFRVYIKRKCGGGLSLILGAALASISAFEAIGGGMEAAVKNVSAFQNKVTRYVEITYDLEAPAACVYNISVEASSGGECLPVKSLSGDFGKVTPGKKKRIEWRIPADWPNHKAKDVVVSVKADIAGGGNLGDYDAITAGDVAYAYQTGQMKSGKYEVKAGMSPSSAPQEQWFIYRTVQGRFGKFKVHNAWCGEFSISFVTYSDDGKVYTKGNAALPFESGFDFDTGAMSKGTSPSHDMKCFWDKKSGSSKHWVQAYGPMKKLR